MNNNIIPFTIENGYNTSYIDTLLVSLFFKNSYIQNILSNMPKEIKFIYLQELIYLKFVSNIKLQYSINSSIINEIRNYMFLCGWKTNENILELYDVVDFYNFLINNFNCNKIIFEKNIDNNIELNYIELNIVKDSNIKNLLDQWIDDNLENYSIKEKPDYISIYLNRNSNSNSNLNYIIDIKEGICFTKNNTDNEYKNIWWKINSIICYSKSEKKYYAILSDDNNNWYSFDSSRIPSLCKINIKESYLAIKIKQECVFLTYILDENII